MDLSYTTNLRSREVTPITIGLLLVWDKNIKISNRIDILLDNTIAKNQNLKTET